MGERPSSRRFLGLLVVYCASVLIVRGAALPLTQAFHTAQLAGSSSSFTGATFVPSVAPVVTARIGASGAELSWARVLTSAGTDVAYRVVRTGPNGATETLERRFPGDREAVRTNSATAALHLVRLLLADDAVRA